LIEIINLVLW